MVSPLNSCITHYSVKSFSVVTYRSDTLYIGDTLCVKGTMGHAF